MTEDIKSRQPRFETGSQATISFLERLSRWTKDAIIAAPPYTKDTRERDAWLRDFWKQEPLMAGVISSVVAIDKNRGWTLIGGRNQVNRFSLVLRNVNAGGGWRQFTSQQSESFWTADIGAIAEIGRVGTADGPLGALWHVDPTRCKLTGKPETPLAYYPSGQGKRQLWTPGDYMRAVSMPSTDETFNGAGYCALSRALDLTVIMVAVYRHDREMLFAALQKGLLLLQGWDEDDWVEAMESNAEQLTAKEREYYAGLTVLFTLEQNMDAKLINLSQLPDNFDLTAFSNILMNGYALCFGYDPREFWPVSGGTLGTGRETEVQAVKATSKGALDFALAFQDNLQRELPPTLLFEFEQRDDAGEQLKAQLDEARARAVNEMSKSPVAGAETLTREERRYLYAAAGMIPEEWTVPEEPTVATDTDSETRERLLSSEQVRRACERYPDEPIVRYTWPGRQIVRLWESGEVALHRHSYPVARIARQEDDEPEPDPEDD